MYAEKTELSGKDGKNQITVYVSAFPLLLIDLFGSASSSVALFSVLGAHQSEGNIEQETRRRGGKRRERLILSGKHLPLLRSLRLRVSCSMFSSLAVQ